MVCDRYHNWLASLRAERAPESALGIALNTLLQRIVQEKRTAMSSRRVTSTSAGRGGDGGQACISDQPGTAPRDGNAPAESIIQQHGGATGHVERTTHPRERHSEVAARNAHVAVDPCATHPVL